MASGPLRPGDRVLLIDDRSRRYLISLKDGGRFHSHKGVLDHTVLIGAHEGCTVVTSGGSRLLALRPTLADYVLKMQRGAQVIYPKDAAMILSHGDIFPGATVIEAGTGSGALTLALARAVGTSGRVISHETRPDHLERARANIEAWLAASGEPAGTIDLRLGDVFEIVPEPAADRIVLDVPEPWRAVGTATEALVAGGILCCYVPTVPQVTQTVEAMRAGGFGEVGALETLVRTWNVRGPSVRPDHRMVAHTGFIVTGRKVRAAGGVSAPVGGALIERG